MVSNAGRKNPCELTLDEIGRKMDLEEFQLEKLITQKHINKAINQAVDSKV
jgi:hypothetical protein